MSHSDRVIEARIGGNRGEWFVTFDPETGDVALRNSEHLVALAPAILDQVQAFATSPIPAGLYLPSVGLDGGWNLLYFPDEGRLLLHNAFGAPVGTTTRAAEEMRRLRALFA